MPGNWPIAARRVLRNESVEDLHLPRQAKHDFRKLEVEMSSGPKNTVRVTFAYDKDLLERFKFEIDGRKWDADEKCWVVPGPQLLKMVELFGGVKNITADDKVKALYRAEIARRKDLDEIRVQDDSDIQINNIKLDLFPYQKVAVDFLMRAGGRGMDADQPGLGKTATAIAYAAHNSLKTLVIAPKSVIIHWQREIERFTGKKATIWSTDAKAGRIDAQYHLINYDIVERRAAELRKAEFDLLVCDEATMLKNRQTKRAKAILGDWKQRKLYPGIKTKHVIFLTGTPVMNRPVEAFALLNFLDKDRFNNFYQFTQKYGGWKGSEPRNLEDLHHRVKDLVIRRLKKNILTELPAKQRNDLYVELSDAEMKEYNTLLTKLFKRWGATGKPTIGEMPAIQQYLIEKKMPRAIEMVDEYLDNDRPILIYSCFIAPLEKLAAHYGDKAVVLHGQMTMSERQKSIDALRSGEAKVGLFSVGAGAMGIDGLQHSIDTVIFLDRWWVPSTHEQAEDRLFRTGQTKQVSCYYFTCVNTLDEYMGNILTEKQKVIDQIVDGGLITGPQNKSFFKEFVSALKKGYLEDLKKVDIAAVDEEIPELEV
jgi:SWI/SNF-related matrix-associated actin-dependent regulator 1 of chromatin subfamily A